MENKTLKEASEKNLSELNLLLENFGTRKKVAKGKCVINEGEKSDFFFYVTKGGFKSYIIKGDREYILGFSFANFLDGCPHSLFSNTKNTYTLEAYVDSEIIKVSLSQLNNFIKDHRDFQQFVQNILVDYINHVESILFDLISKTAEERYLELLTEHGNKIELISLTDLAKYLGISLERLSRIRKKNGLI
jgi:CRP/FNR family transcriptional regulator, anaerobic regulatory protein